MTDSTVALGIAAHALVVAGMLGVSFAACCVAPLPRPALGRRGVQRARALAQAPVFRAAEPAIRYLGALLAPHLRPGLRARLSRLVTHAGEACGLCPEECLALCTLVAAMAGAVAAALADTLELPGALPALATVVGGALPLSVLHAQGQRRARRIALRLPAAIDLLALCMGAGLDFAGALRVVAGQRRDHASDRAGDAPPDALLEELAHVRRDLAIGRTRRAALGALAERVPHAAARDFVAAVVQAEQEGSPLSEVLAIQAQMLRMKRSVAAEEAATRASLMLMAPLVLLMGCVLLIMFGPFLINGIGL